LLLGDLVLTLGATLLPYVNWLRAIAAVLIVNSHLETQYPISQAAVDGLLGNSIFFFLAGLGLVASERNSQRSFADWYGRRLVRIVPSVLLAVLVIYYLPEKGWNAWSAIDYFQNIVVPPRYRFVQQILVFYVPFFLVQRLGGRRGNAWVFGLLLVAMLIAPAFGDRSVMFHPFHWLSHFTMMLFGAWMGWRDEPTPVVTPRLLGGFAVSALAYGLTKLATAQPLFTEWYPLLHLLVFPLIFLGVQVIQAEAIARFVDRHPRFNWTIGLVGGLTLEIYLVHYAVLDSSIVARLAFPANIAVIMAGTVLLAIPLAWGAEGVRQSQRWIGGVLRKKGAVTLVQGPRSSPSSSPS
jgi:peptidoglycan/LPS O-acetylase OafA/YrhL